MLKWCRMKIIRRIICNGYKGVFVLSRNCYNSNDYYWQRLYWHDPRVDDTLHIEDDRPHNSMVIEFRETDLEHL